MSVASSLAIAFLAGGVAPPALIRIVSPRVIEVGAFYEGANVRVEGVAPPGSQMIVTVTGSERPESFNRKARFGPIWLNAGKVRISGAPSLFLRFSAGPVLVHRDRECMAGRELDEAAVRQRIHIGPAPPDPRTAAALGSDYLALKQSDGVYSFTSAGIVMGSPEAGGTPYTLRFRWPKKAPPGEYYIHAYSIRNGAVESQAEAIIPVVRAGFPAWLAGLAENHAPLYGITAVLIGALAGFGIDFLSTRLFGKKRRVGH
jgi:hypothetical protein